MRTTYLLTVFLFCSFIVKAQQATNEKATKKDVTVLSLNQKFSAKVLNAYQENSKTKVEDLYSYFQLLTDASLSDDLKKEVVKNIQFLFQNKNEMVIDFTSQSLDKIPLQQFIDKLLISEPILFAISNESNYNAVDYQSWNTNYTVSRTKSGLISKTKINQKIYFMETEKSFGSEMKLVFSTFLGSME